LSHRVLESSSDTSASRILEPYIVCKKKQETYISTLDLNDEILGTQILQRILRANLHVYDSKNA